MARRLSGREIVLLVLLGSAGLWYAWYATQKDVESKGAGAGDDAGAARLADQAPVVRMDLLARRAEPYDPKGRDLFKFSKRPPSAEELEAARLARLKAQQDAEARRKEVLERQVKQRETARTRDPTPPSNQPPGIPLKYLGYLGPKEDKIAVFDGGEENLLLARRGEVVQDRFRVVEIRYETVVMGYTDPKFEEMTRELTMAMK